MISSTSEYDSIRVMPCWHPSQERQSQVQVVVPEYFMRKALSMRVLAGLLLVGSFPIMLLAMLLVRLTSSGPALFRQTRVGRDGRRFELVKIRTMYRDAEKLSGPVLCQPGDSRITPMGRLLRFLHLDELPQLVNVIRGEMCLIGPRPERPEIIARNRLNEIVPGFSERTKVLPGVTGLAQINLPADQTAECVIPKVQLDLEYITSANASLDVRILLCTAMRMLGVRHGRAVKLLGLVRTPAVNSGSTRVDGGNKNGDRSQKESNGHKNGQVKAPAAFAYSSINGVYDASNRPFESTTLVSRNGDAVEPVGQPSDAAFPPGKPR